MYSLEHWNQSKITFLKRLLVTAHARHTNPSGTTKYDIHLLVFNYIIFHNILLFYSEISLNNSIPFVKKDSLVALPYSARKDPGCFVVFVVI